MCGDLTKHDHRHRGIVWMRGSRPVVTIRPRRSGGWLVSFKDRRPYANDQGIVRSSNPTHCRHFARKADAVADVEQRLACTA